MLFVLCSVSGYGQKEVYLSREAQVSFVSDAPLELIRASSSGLQGVIDPEEGTFAFRVSIRSFDGFNSPLQREHFNENYMESDVYSEAVFSGRIIEEIDFEKEGEYTLRAKGKLSIHGVSNERIIKSEVVVEKNEILLTAFFTVLLEEHDIDIPRIVYQKIAEEIEVKVEAVLKKVER